MKIDGWDTRGAPCERYHGWIRLGTLLYCGFTEMMRKEERKHQKERDCRTEGKPINLKMERRPKVMRGGEGVPKREEVPIESKKERQPEMIRGGEGLPEREGRQTEGALERLGLRPRAEMETGKGGESVKTRWRVFNVLCFLGRVGFAWALPTAQTAQ